jgi:hypothetical protein
MSYAKFFLGILVAALMLPLAATATGNTQAKPSASRENSAEKAKDTFVSQMSTKLDKWEDQISQAKKDRDAKAKNSRDWVTADMRIISMEARLKEARDHMKGLKDAEGSHWQHYQSKVNDILADLGKMTGQRSAE